MNFLGQQSDELCLPQVIQSHHFILYNVFTTITFRRRNLWPLKCTRTEGSKSKSKLKLNHHTFINIRWSMALPVTFL